MSAESTRLQKYADELQKLKALIANDPHQNGTPPRNSRKTPVKKNDSPRTFQEEKKALLNHISNSTPRGRTDARPTTEENSESSAAIAEKYHDILGEVETLSNTVTSLQIERANLEDSWSKRLQSLRGEIEDRDALIAALEEREETLKKELKAKEATNEQQMLEVISESDDYNKHRISTLENRIQFLTKEAAEREGLIQSQDEALSQLEVQLEAATGAAVEWEKRFMALKTTKDEASKSLEEDREHTLQRAALLADTARLLVDAHTTVQNAAGHKGSTADAIAAIGFINGVAKGAVELEGADATSVVDPCLRVSLHCVDSLKENIQREKDGTAAITKRMEQQSTELSETMSKLSNLSVEKQRLDDELSLTQNSAEMLEKQVHQQEDVITALKSELQDSEGSISKLNAICEEGSIDIHRARLRINELEAQTMRLKSQRELSEQNAETLVTEHRSSEKQKEQVINRLKVQLEESKQTHATDVERLKHLDETNSELKREIAKLNDALFDARLKSTSKGQGPRSDVDVATPTTTDLPPSIRTVSAAASRSNSHINTPSTIVSAEAPSDDDEALTIEEETTVPRAKHMDSHSMSTKSSRIDVGRTRPVAQAGLVSSLRLQRDKASQRCSIHTSYLEETQKEKLTKVERENQILNDRVAQLRNELQHSSMRQSQLIREKKMMEAVSFSTPKRR